MLLTLAVLALLPTQANFATQYAHILTQIQPHLAPIQAFVDAHGGHPMLPDPKLTPGDTDPTVTQGNIKQTICKSGYTKTVRSVSEAEKREVMIRYGLPLSELHAVEIDHDISLEIGGSNAPGNLWPQYYEPAPGQNNYLGAREKDVVETSLKRAVCSGKINLPMAQLLIHAWPEYYRKLKGMK